MSEDKSLEENSAGSISLNPGMTIGGIGDPVLPTATTVGSGDVLDVADIDDDEEEAKKDKTKKKLEMEGFKLFTQFNNFVTEGKISNFKFGQKKQYSPDDINTEYGFWGTLDVNMDPESIEEIWHGVWGILTKSWKFSDAGALYYLNAKAGRHLADKVYNDINSQISQPDAIDMILSDYVRPSQWKAWAKEYNEFAQEELAESNKIYESASMKVNEWGSSDQSIFLDAMHKDAGKPKKMPSPFDSKLRAAAEDAVDFYWEDWPEYKSDREGLVDDAVRSYLRRYFKKDFEMMQRMFEPMESLKIEEGKSSDELYESALLENAVRDLHFETDPKKAEELKIEIGTSQGEVTRKKQIEGGEYSLRRFRKEIKYDTTGEDLGVFKPGSYMAATSKLGDGPHKKAVKKVKWNRKKYDQWLEDVASNDGWKNAFDMAQNAKQEPGLLQWAKKEFRGEDVMQRIQWDIEAFAESVTKKPFAEWYKLNEAKSVDRDEMMKWIKKSMDFVGTTEEFSGSQGGIHVSGEDGDEFKGNVIYNYYSEDYKNREFGVWNKWEKELNKRGWYSEWYDAGTVCIWPL